MTKMVLTFEADNWTSMFKQLNDASNSIAFGIGKVPSPDAQGVTVEISPTGAGEDAPLPTPPAPRAAKAATRKRPEQAAPPPPVEDIAPEFPEAVEPPVVPSLEELKQAVTVAVRAAQKNGGSRKILDLLPGFKQATGLDFVMNSKEEHRQALFELTNQAGINVGLAAV